MGTLLWIGGAVLAVLVALVIFGNVYMRMRGIPRVRRPLNPFPEDGDMEGEVQRFLDANLNRRRRKRRGG